MAAQDDLTRRISEFVARKSGFPLRRMTTSTRLGEDAGLSGDDLSTFVDDFGREFGVDVGRYRPDHHRRLEDCDPLWLLLKPWWLWQTYIPIRVADLVESARRGVWCVEYPEEEREG